MIEPNTRLRFATALGVALTVALGFGALYLFLVFTLSSGPEPPPVETPEARRARCLAPPSQRVLLTRLELAQVGDGDLLVRSASIAPALAGSATVGLAVTDIRPGSLLDRVGLCHGDVVSSLGGVPLDGFGAALEAYEHVQGLQAVPVEILRGGRKFGFLVEVN